MSGILDSVIGSVTSQLSGSLGSQLGESSDAIRKGLETGSASILGGIANKAGDTSFINKIFSMATSATSRSAAAGAGTSHTSDAASGLLSTVFGSQQSSIIDTIGRVSGLKPGSASGLMTALAPAVLGYLGTHIASSGLNASSFASLLKSEAPSISRVLPAGISFTAPVAQVPPLATAVVREDKKTNWLWPALLLGGLLLAGLLWWFNRPHEVVAPEVAVVAKTAETAVNAVATAVPVEWAKLGDKIERSLPNAPALNVPKLGVENRLLDYIVVPGIDSNKWFDFDRLLFDTDSAKLQPASNEQLTNVANILKAYPNIKVRIGGYTDNTGDAAHNLQLSQERATSVMNELVKLGVSADRMDAKGYGPEHPVADNATEDGRQANRRVSLRITAK
jgi:OmpA-OmpF porin, OOP family